MVRNAYFIISATVNLNKSSQFLLCNVTAIVGASISEQSLTPSNNGQTCCKIHIVSKDWREKSHQIIGQELYLLDCYLIEPPLMEKLKSNNKEI